MDFIKDAAQRRFYMVELEKLLENYAPGRPEMKPDVIAQTLQLEKERAKMAEDAAAAGGGGQIILQQPGQAPVTLNNQQVIQIIQKLQTELEERNKEIARITDENQALKEKYEELLRRMSSVPAADTVSSTTTTTTSADNSIIYV
jgi:hypothetical protein